MNNFMLCLVCGKEQDEPVWGENGCTPSFNICSCCGVEFGYGDCNMEAIHASRQKWLEEGSKLFKAMFDKIAKHNGFQSAFGGWFMESDECIIALDLQKSNYSNRYELNIRIFVQGVFHETYTKSKDLIKKHTGDVFRAQPKEYDAALDLEKPMTNKERERELQAMFSEFIVPYAQKALKRTGIHELVKEGKAFLLGAVQKELERLDKRK